MHGVEGRKKYIQILGEHGMEEGILLYNTCIELLQQNGEPTSIMSGHTE